MPSIGETLREARMRQRLDIADVESKTKIRAKYLRALENEEFGMLPGPTFVKTFLRTYAEVLGLDPHLLVEEYRVTYESREETDQVQPLGPPSAVARERRRGGRSRTPGPFLVLGLVVVAVVGALAAVGLLSGDGDGEEQASEPEPTETAPPRTEREPAPAPRPKRVVLRIAPVAETYVCIDTGPGTEPRFEGTLTAPRTWRGRRLRVNLGNTSVELTKNGKPFAIEPSSAPVGFAFTVRSSRQIPLGERPCA